MKWFTLIGYGYNNANAITVLINQNHYIMLETLSPDHQDRTIVTTNSCKIIVNKSIVDVQEDISRAFN